MTDASWAGATAVAASDAVTDASTAADGDVTDASWAGVTPVAASDADVIAALAPPTAYDGTPVGETPISIAERSERPKRVARTDWRLGGRTVFRWREGLLAIALVSLGLGVLAGVAIDLVWTSPWAPVLGTVLVWLGMLVPIVVAVRRSRPIGLLRFRALDVLYGVVLGGMLRLVQGSVALAGGDASLPSYPLVDGALDRGWIITDGVGAAVVGPTIEEFFFRGVLLVALYTVLRRPLGAVASGVTAALVTSGVFVLVHALSAPTSVDGVVGLALLGLVCGILVLLTGRIWGAVLVHVVYNASFVALALVGTFLG